MLEDLDSRNSRWPILERVPCGHRKRPTATRERIRRMWKVACPHHLHAKIWKNYGKPLCSPDSCRSFGHLIQTWAGCFRERVTNNREKGWLHISKGYFSSEIWKRLKFPNYSRISKASDVTITTNETDNTNRHFMIKMILLLYQNGYMYWKGWLIQFDNVQYWYRNKVSNPWKEKATLATHASSIRY